MPASEAQQQSVTLWINAARDGNHELLAQLLSESPELLEAVDEFSSTALHEAAFHGHLRVVELLLAASPELTDKVDAQGRTALHMAAMNNSLLVAERLLDTYLNRDSSVVSIDEVDSHGKNAEQYAYDQNFFHLAAQITAAESQGFLDLDAPALHSAVLQGNYELVAKLLAEHPNWIRTKDNHGWTVLHVAAQLGDPKMMAILLAVASPDVIHQNDYYCETALHVAARRPKMVAQLLAASPELASATDTQGHKTMLHWAVDSASVEVAAQLLAVNPELIDQVNVLKRTPLHCAAYQRRPDFAEMFLARKPDLIHAVDRHGLTALHHAVCGKENCSPKEFEEFIERLVALNPSAVHAVCDSHKRTPLCYAILNTSASSLAINILQPKSFLDDIVHAYGEKSRRLSSSEDDQIDRAKQLSFLRPVLRDVCECLLELLNQDVVSVVYEYLGLKELKEPVIVTVHVQ